MRILACLFCLALTAGCTRDNSSFTGGNDMSIASGDLAGVDLSSLPTDLAGVDQAGIDFGGVDLSGMCTPNAFLVCIDNDAIYCDSTGTTTTSFGCGQPCLGTPSGCGQCVADGCLDGAIITCDTDHDRITSSTPCVTLQAGGPPTALCEGDVCAACTGPRVCGDGITTSANVTYDCTNGVLDFGSVCLYGCDPQTGGCRDVVPANQAAAHLAPASPTPMPSPADFFTCIGTQDATLPSVIAGAGDTLTFDTSLGTVSTASQTFAARWGTPYKPTGSNTNVVVAHINSLAVDGAATMNVTGSRGLVLLVDGDVDFSGGTDSAFTQIVVTASPAATTSGRGGIGGGSEGGGGGAGHNTHGNKGGAGGGGGGGGEAGGTYGSAVILEAGGTGGSGAGLSVSTSSGNGGAGGGGLQITACGAIHVGADVVINASGSGGGAGVNKTGVPFAGGGGGAGGTLIFEATSLTLTGMLVSNGGGGGGGADIGGDGSEGDTWSWIQGISVGTVAGGGAGNGNGGSGGDGGAGGTLPVAGNPPANAASGAGGGGGGVGRIFVNVPPGSTPPVASAASPGIKTSNFCLSGQACSYP